MGRDQKPPFARCRLSVFLIAFCIAGCGGNTNVQTSSGASASVQGQATLSSLFLIGILGAVLSGDAPVYPAPEMDPTRRVVEQDCRKPIEDWSANLMCR